MQLSGLRHRWRMKQLGRSELSHSRRLATSLAVHPLVATLLLHRGVSNSDVAKGFLLPQLTDLHDPQLLPGVTRAADRLCQAVADGQPIVIYGDYDVDGITASAVLWHLLKLAGADVRVYVPHRIEEGYGLNSDAIMRLASTGPLIVSVDCGITAAEPARTAKAAGIDLIITDHHHFDPPTRSRPLPEAHTLVHPCLPGSQYPHGTLCGAAVAFKLGWQFARAYCGSDRLPGPFKQMLLDLLSYVALGTIADVVPLVGENRVLAVHGLGRIKQTQFVGLNALIDASGLRDEKIDAYHVGFVLAPRLNACGRMGHASQASRLLTDADSDEAVEIADFLTKENLRRREVEREIFQEAKAMVIDGGYDSADCRAIVLGKAGWHSGVIGIVASRLVEAYSRPVVMLSYQDDSVGGEAQGSARSVDRVSICEAFDHCASLLNTYGGHAMAAGLRMNVERVDAFRRQLVDFVNSRLDTEDLISTIEIDAECTLEDVTVEVLEQLDRLAPFGRSNPWPVFRAQDVMLDRMAQRVGGGGKHLRLLVRQGRRLVSAVGFGLGELAEQLPVGVRLDVVFEPKLSNWQGRKRAEMHIKDLRVRD